MQIGALLSAAFTLLYLASLWVNPHFEAVIVLAACVAGLAASMIGWRFALRGRMSVAARLLIVNMSASALASIWASYTALPLSLSLLTGGALLSIPFLSTRAYRQSVYFCIGVFVLVGIIYIFHEPTEAPLSFYLRVLVYIGCLTIVLLMSYLVFRTSDWMHSKVREVRRANAALLNVQAGLEDTIQLRTAELMQANLQLTSEIGERRRIESQLRDQKAFLEALHDTSLDII